MKLSWKEANWLLVAGVFTIAYAGFVAYTLGWGAIQNFLTTNQKLNEIGDFLAGVFAPIALIWLIAAVLTQRQELNETRDQFAQNQKVVDAQLKTIKSQNELLTLQHEQAVENAVKAYKLSLFDKRLQIYKDFIQLGQEGQRADYWNSYPPMIDLAQQAAFVFDVSLEEWFSEIAEKVEEFNKFRENNPFSHNLNSVAQAQLEKQCEVYRNSINAEFSPEERIERFWKFMHVSDQPYMQAS